MPARISKRTNGESSRKRARPVADDEDEDEEVIAVAEASSSNSAHSHRKRVRLSNGNRAHEASRASVDDEEEYEDGDGEDDVDVNGVEDEDGVPAATQYEDLRDNNFEHLQHEKEDDLRATQRIKSRPSIIGDNRAAENGILESITCVNFMCHERLHCELGPLMNFIVGENGSGKSAILTAITLCLGGKASSTNRGGSLKSFVKEGKDQGVLTVRIKNQGVDAYQHDIYGDSIIVERHFSRAGSSGFKAKSATGKLISNKRNEVSEIVEYFCLQVDNPLNVLSQDNARQFLNAASDAQKYKFFVEGVQLEQLDTDYRLIAEFLESTSSKLPEQEERVKRTKKASDQAQKLAESIRQNSALRAKRRALVAQLAWAQVRDQEDILTEREQAVEESNARIAAAEETAEHSSQAYAAANEKVEREEAKMNETVEEGAEMNAALETATTAYQKAKKELAKIRGDERDAKLRLDDAKKRLDQNETKIVEEKRLMEASQGGEVARKREALEAKQAEKSEIDKETEENKGKLGPLQEQLANANREHAKAVRLAEAKHKEIKAVENKLASLERGCGSALDGYHPRIPQLLRQIADDNGFREKPIGPVGTTISVLKPQWTSILEATLGRNLNAFVVSNPADQRRLQAMMRRLQINNVPILIGNRNRLDPRSHEPDEHFDTIMRVLRFDNDIVRDQLIIGTAIEQVLLIEQRVDAEKVMFNGPAPRNVKACLCFHDTKRGQGLRLNSKFGGSSIGTSAVVPTNEKPRMKSDVQSQIAEQREILSQYRAELQLAVRKREDATRKAAEFEEGIKQQRRTADELSKRERHCNAAIMEIEAALDSYDGYDERLTVLEEARVQIQEEYELYGGQYGSMVANKEEHNKKVEHLKAELDNEKDRQSDFASARRKQERTLEMCQDARRAALNHKNQAFEAIDEHKATKRRAERALEEQRETVEQFKTQAGQIAAERVFVPEGATLADLQNRMKAITKQLEASARRVGKSDEEVQAEAHAAKTAYEEAKRTYGGSMTLVRSLHETLSVRLEKWRLFQRYISANARVNFLYLLSERGYRGELCIDHVNKRLRVQVEPDQAQQAAAGRRKDGNGNGNSNGNNGGKAAAGRNTKTLSGGEKSFSSICLLLAIWDSMGSPLRCLDEFDVFMDNVNRAISTNMLVGAARRSVGRQYIMITPNAIEGRAKLDKDVKIIRMTDPRQRTMKGYAVNPRA